MIHSQFFHRLIPLALMLPLSAAAPEKLELGHGEHVTIIGNALAERMLHDGTLEALIHRANPQADISIRNLGFAADEVNSHMRSDGVPPPNDWLEKTGADAILAFWGFNESFKGPQGLEAFRKDLDQYLKELAGHKFNGVEPPHVVLFSPIAQEKGTDPNWPDPTENNYNLKSYTDAMAEVARENDVQFVDLFTPSQKLYEMADQPLTHNGIHLTVDGYQQLAPVLYAAAFGANPPESDPQLEKIRAAVVEKNVTWLARYRTVDQYNIFGGRSTIDYESKNTDGEGRDNRYVLFPEMAVRDVMTQNRENRVWALAKGGDMEIDDSNVPEVPTIGTNRPGPNPDGSYTYLDPEEAIKHMKVPKGVKVELVASEKDFPELVSPVQMAWDAQGRLWVSAWKNYPERTPDSQEGDKLLIFDIGPDGKATKCTTFFDDLNCPTGFQFYKDGVFVMKSPELLYLRDTDGDGRGEVIERVLNGMDAADSHHETNSMVLEPGGAMYLSDGVFHRTQVETASGPVRNVDGGIFRWEPRTGRFERYVAYGFANPHGRVFDYWGNDIITDATGNANYFAPAFSGHIDFPGTHPGMKEFWDRPSRPCSGTALLSSRAWPEEYQGNFLNCNVISLQGVFRASISEEGSGLAGKTLENLISSDDPNFRPSGISVAPDGSLYLMDWHKPLIGHLQHHLRDPNREQEHGRIYRLSFEGMPLLKPAKIHGEPITALLELLKTPENNVRERAKIELGTHPTAEVMAELDQWLAELDSDSKDFEHHRLEGLWLKQYHNIADPALLAAVLASPEPRARAQAVRVLCYQRERFPNAIQMLKSAAADEAPRVRLEAVRALSFFRNWEAADAALAALKFPTDYYIDYCLKETMRQLEAWWKAAITEGEPIAQGNPAGISYILSSVSTPDLARLPKSNIVYTALLTRRDVAEADRIEALSALSSEQKSSRVEVILEVLSNPELSSEAAEVMCRLLLEQPLADLKSNRAGIAEAMERGFSSGSTRASLTAASLLANGSLGESFAAVRTPAQLTDLLRAISLLPDPKLRASAATPITTYIEDLPPVLADRMREGGTEARYVRISLPGQGTLSLGEVAVMSDGKNIARGGNASQSSTGYGGDASRAIDGNASGTYSDGGMTHTQENQENTWWELDLGKARPLQTVRIWNRTDGNNEYANRLDGFTLTLLDGQRQVIATMENQPAPMPDAEIPLKVDSIGEYRRAAIAALLSTGQDPALTFGTLAKMAEQNREIPAAIQALAALPRSSWQPTTADSALIATMKWAESVPALERVDETFSATLDAALKLCEALPDDRAAIAKTKLSDLRVELHVIHTVREKMKYDVSRLVVPPGKPFAVSFENVDMMPHNILFVMPGMRQIIAEEVQTMAPDKLDSEGRAYMPGDGTKLDPRVLAASRMIEPGQKDVFIVQAPETEGEYPYVCTFPGHWSIMWGTMIVTKDVDAYRTAHPQN